jgi:glycosyltransferase involved in cell wall biosynthesis
MVPPILAIIIPSFNEEKVLDITFKRLATIMENLIDSSKISTKSFILFVDDGSADQTWNIIKHLEFNNIHVKGLKLSRNFGHQNALISGLMSVKDIVDFAISIDADLQQDENAIPQFIEKYYEGFEIVYGIRKNRKTDNLLKKATAVFFYKLMQIMGVKIIKNHADYRLVSRRVMNALSDYQEVNLFLRGLIPTLGFKSTTIFHEVRDRFAGKSKYSFKKMLSFALNGITSFSIVPIRIISCIGFLIFAFSLVMSFYVIFEYLIGHSISGWASTVLPIYFIGGIQLLSLGLIGEYIGKMYIEVKRRPRFIIEDQFEGEISESELTNQKRGVREKIS